MSKLIVIVGPTASGKSALALRLAQNFNGEIINADSRSVYRYMDIGTAKPTNEEMLSIKHHLVNIKNPNEAYSAAQFKHDALLAIEKIGEKGKLPILVGGTGLYIDSILYDYKFPARENRQLRALNRELSLDELVVRLKDIDPLAAEKVDLKNPRRVMRAIETAGASRSKAKTIRSNSLTLGLALSKESIQMRIRLRIEKMLEKGLIDEVKYVGETFGWDTEAMTGPAYRAFKDVILGTKTTSEAADEFARRDVSLAKRQMTWFKRNKDIQWLDAEDPDKLLLEAESLVQKFMSPQ